MPDFVFADNAQVEDINAVPQQFQGLYQQSEDGSAYVLSDTAKPLADAYDGMARNFEDAKNKKKSANDESAKRRQQLKAFEELAGELDIDVNSIDGENKTLAGVFKEQIDNLRQQASNGKDIQVNIDKVKQDADKRVSEVTQAKDKEIEAMQGALHRHMVSDVAVRAVTEAKGSVDLLQPHIERHCKVAQSGTHPDGTPKFEVVVMDADGDVRTNGKGDNMTVGELVAEMKQSEKFARAFESETPGGSGAQPGSMSSQPARRLTQQEDMSSTDKIAAGLKRGNYRRGRG